MLQMTILVVMNISMLLYNIRKGPIELPRIELREADKNFIPKQHLRKFFVLIMLSESFATYAVQIDNGLQDWIVMVY